MPQGLQFPRDVVYIDNVLQDSETIPQLLIDAQIRAASVSFEGGNLFPTGLNATSKSVGDVSLSYGGGKADNSAWMGDVMNLLKPLFKDAAFILFHDFIRAGAFSLRNGAFPR